MSVNDNHGHRTNPFDENGAYVEPTKAPWTFEFEDSPDHPLTIESAVFTALGAASVCWENMSGTGVFQSEHAKEIGDKLVAYIQEKIQDAEMNAIQEEREGM